MRLHGRALFNARPHKHPAAHPLSPVFASNSEGTRTLPSPNDRQCDRNVKRSWWLGCLTCIMHGGELRYQATHVQGKGPHPFHESLIMSAIGERATLDPANVPHFAEKAAAHQNP